MNEGKYSNEFNLNPLFPIYIIQLLNLLIKYYISNIFIINISPIVMVNFM
jgi:hypothetical protein